MSVGAVPAQARTAKREPEPAGPDAQHGPDCGFGCKHGEPPVVGPVAVIVPPTPTRTLPANVPFTPPASAPPEPPAANLPSGLQRERTVTMPTPEPPATLPAGRVVMPSGLTPLSTPPPPASRPAPRPKPKTTKGATTLPVGAHVRGLEAALAGMPQWYWNGDECIRLKIGDDELTWFSRGDAFAHWFTIPAKTTGHAELQLPRPGVALLRNLRGEGGVVLKAWPDRLTCGREDGGEQIVVPAQPAVVPAIPDMAVTSGLLIGRAALLAVFEQQINAGELCFAWDGNGTLQVGELVVEPEYATGKPFEVILSPRLVLPGLRKGTGDDCEIELGDGLHCPVVCRVGCLTAAIAQMTPESSL